MECSFVIERLPWLLNRTLPDAEERDVRTHLKKCDACRRELEQTAWVWEAHRRHLAPEVLVALAAGESIAMLEDQAIDAHLQACDDCSDSLSSLRSGRAALDGPPRAVAARGGEWRLAAIAASLAGVVGLAGWLMQERRVDRLQQRLSVLESPEVNVPLIEIAPGESLRGETTLSTEIRIPHGARSVTLVLLPGRATGSDLSVRLIDADGEQLWGGTGLRRSELGDFTLSLPTSILQPGSMFLEIVDTESAQPIERYPIRILLND